jgi:hypothetical protein
VPDPSGTLACVQIYFQKNLSSRAPQMHFTSVAGDKSLKICSTLILTALFL